MIGSMYCIDNTPISWWLMNGPNGRESTVNRALGGSTYPG